VGKDGQKGRRFRAALCAVRIAPLSAIPHVRKNTKNRATATQYAAFAQPIESFRFSALALHFEQSSNTGGAV
jgi:hypothetical protein